MADELLENGAPEYLRNLHGTFAAGLTGIAETYGAALLLEALLDVVAVDGASDAAIRLSDDFGIEATTLVPINSITSQVKSGTYLDSVRKDLVLRSAAAFEYALLGMRDFAGTPDPPGELLDRYGIPVRSQALRSAVRLAKVFEVRFHFELGGDLVLMDSLISVRNDLLHNGGVASKRLASCPRSFFGRTALGDRISVQHNAIDDLISYLDATVSPAFAIVAYATMGRRDLLARWGNRSVV